MKYKIFYLIVLSLLIVGGVSSCQDQIEGMENSNTEGALHLGVETSLEVTATRADVQPGEDVDKYAVLINKAGEPYAGYDTYADMPENKNIKLYGGDYNIETFWGSDVAAAFNAPYYYGTEDFTILSGETTSLEVACKLSNTKITLVYTDSFIEGFKGFITYRTEFTTEHTTSPLIFNKVEKRSAYFKPAPFTLTLFLTKSTGETVTYSIPTISEGIVAGNHYIIKLRGEGVHDPEVGLIVEINEATNDVIETVNVPISSLVQAEPVVKMSTDAADSHTFLVYNNTDLSKSFISHVNCVSGIKELYLSTTSDFFTTNGLPEEIAISAVDSDPVIAAKLLEIGVEIEQESVLGQSSYIIRFDKILNNLSMSNEDSKAHKFTVRVVDAINRVAENSFVINTLKPQFVSNVQSGNLWTDRAVLTPLAVEDVTLGDFTKMEDLFVYEYSDNKVDWVEYTPSKESFTFISSLKPATKYYWRVRYLQFISPVAEVSTESLLQMPNSGMEEWHSARHIIDDRFHDWRVFPNPGTEFWGSYNQSTNEYGSNNAYTKRSGTQPTTDVKSGSKAARLSTVGWGSGNTMIGGPGYIQYNTTAGKLVTGHINKDGNLDVNGREFLSRPKKMKYWFQHIPYAGQKYRAMIKIEHRDSEGTVTLLGTSDMHIDGAKYTTYTQHEIAITYDVNFLDLAPTHIYVEFASAEHDTLSKDKTQRFWGNEGLFAGYSDTYTEGSVLLIDDISLVY